MLYRRLRDGLFALVAARLAPAVRPEPAGITATASTSFACQPSNLDRGRGRRRLGVDVAVAYLEEHWQVPHVDKEVGDFDHVLETGAD